MCVRGGYCIAALQLNCSTAQLSSLLEIKPGSRFAKSPLFRNIFLQVLSVCVFLLKPAEGNDEA